MKENIYHVSIAIERISLSYEVENQLEGLSEHITHDVYVLPKEKRLLLEEFEEKVVRDLYNSSLCTMFDGTDRYFENINENIRENWFGSDGIPKVVMTEEQYDEFLLKFNRYKDEYNQIKIEVIAEYDQLQKSFENGFKDAFPSAEKITIPSKEEYEQSYNMAVYPLEFKINQISDKRVLQKYDEYLAQKSQ